MTPAARLSSSTSFSVWSNWVGRYSVDSKQLRARPIIAQIGFPFSCQFGRYRLAKPYCTRFWHAMATWAHYHTFGTDIRSTPYTKYYSARTRMRKSGIFQGSKLPLLALLVIEKSLVDRYLTTTLARIVTFIYQLCPHHFIYIKSRRKASSSETAVNKTVGYREIYRSTAPGTVAWDHPHGRDAHPFRISFANHRAMQRAELPITGHQKADPALKTSELGDLYSVSSMVACGHGRPRTLPLFPASSPHPLLRMSQMTHARDCKNCGGSPSVLVN
jgi:hypothetical protein